MEKLVIDGGDRLNGTVPISGAKNAALPIMTATLLCTEPVRLTQVPDLRDIHTLLEILGTLGVNSTWDEDALELDASSLDQREAPYDLVRKMRASVLVLGPLVSRWGSAKVSLPGGCAIGTRPIDMHLDGLRALGAEVDVNEGYVRATADQLQGAEIYLDFPSVGATENLMMAATLADGETVIENAAREPEIGDLGRFLNHAGARVEGAGTDTVRIHGVDQLGEAEHSVLEDRIEAGTYLTAAAATGGSVEARGIRPKLIQSVLHKLSEAGCEVKRGNRSVRLTSEDRPRATDAVTRPYPGFPTDMQAQFMALMCLADGTSRIKETIFEERFTHVLELERLGADTTIDGNTVTVRGVEQLQGAPVMASDLRASAALVIAGLAAEGTTEVRRVYHLDRGYENLESKLIDLNADIKREPAEGPS